MIEILLVVFFLSMVVVPIIGYFITSVAPIEEMSIARAVAASQMEIFRNQPYRQVSQISGELELAVPADFQTRLAAKLSVKELIPGKLLRIVITTSWTKPRAGKITFATLLANQRPAADEYRR